MNEQNAFSLLFAVFMLFTCRDVFYGQTGQTAESEHNNVGPMKDPLHHHHQHHHMSNLVDRGVHGHTGGAPELSTVTIQYCHSCGYRQAFDEVSKMLNTNFPEIKVVGELHQPKWFRSQIVNLLFFTKIALLAMIYMNTNPFAYLRMETPRWWNYLTQSRISSSLMILFLANSIESSMMSTGAFEIYYNDLPIWSKIETGKMPTGQDILSQIQQQRGFNLKSTLGDFRT